MDRLNGKVVIVTGGAAGIGAAVARQCVAEGARVTIADVNDQEGQRLAEACGASARYAHLDVIDARGWDDVVAGTEAAWLSGLPARLRMTGAKNSWKVKIAEVGKPGSTATGLPPMTARQSGFPA